MRLLTLGGLTLEGSSFQRPKSLLLLAYLAVEGARDRRHLRELFWPDAADAAGSLRVVIAQLRVVSPGLVHEDGTRLSLGVPSDVDALLSAMRDDPSQMVERYPGAFLEDVALPDWSAELEEWVLLTREFLADQVRGHLLKAAQVEAARNNVKGAAELAGRAWQLRGAPPAEPDDLRQVHALLTAGNSVLRAAVRREAQELGVRLPVQPGAAPTPPPQTVFGFPTASTVFIGRQAERLELQSLLSDPEVRLLTLLGPGGIGKTRLALDAAGTVSEGRVVYVPLETVQEAAQVIGVVATTLGQSFNSREDALQGVIRTVADERVLLVLDNVEQVLDAAEDVSALLDACPALTVMTTSRGALNTGWETVYPVPGLEVTAQEDADAVRLFTDRARRANARFRLTPQSLPAVLEICRRVDGSPLALELAAPWIRTLSVEQVAQAVGRDTELLEGTVPGVSPRHRSIRSVFEQSWEKLATDQQELLSGLSVFYGGFTREAAAAVLGATLPQLLNLVGASFIKVDARGRFDRHPLVFEFIREKLEADPNRQRTLELAHARYFQRESDAAYDATYTGLHVVQQLSWLHTEFDNLQAALSGAGKYSEIEAGLWLCRNLTIQWASRNQNATAVTYIETFLERLGSLDSTPVHAWALLEVALIKRGTGTWSPVDQVNFERGFKIAVTSGQGQLISRAFLVEADLCLEIHRDRIRLTRLMHELIRCDDHYGLHVASVDDRVYLAKVHVGQLEIEAARSLLIEALEICDRHGLDLTRAHVLSVVSSVHLYAGDYAAAEKTFESPHHKEMTTHLDYLEGYYSNLARIYFGRSRLADARLNGDLRLARQYAQLSMESRMGWRMPGEMTSPFFGDIILLEGEVTAAIRYCRRGLEDNRLHGFPPMAAGWHLSLGTALLCQGDTECLEQFRLALAGQPLKVHLAAVIDQIAIALGTFGQAQVAPTLWGATARLRRDTGFVKPPIWMDQYEGAVIDVTAQLGQSAFDAAWAAGTTLSFSDALALASNCLPS